jgi:hypothetical protein
MTDDRKAELLAESEHLKSKWRALSNMANEAHEKGNHCIAWSLLAEMTGVLADEAKIAHELGKGVYHG